MENLKKQVLSNGGSQSYAFLTNGSSSSPSSKCAFGSVSVESGSPCSSGSEQEPNGDIGEGSFLGSIRSGGYSSEKLTPPLSDEETGMEGTENGGGGDSLHEDTLAFSGLEVEESRLETTGNCSVSEGELSVDMFAQTPAACKVGGVSFNSSSSEILVPATQQVEEDPLSSEECSEVVPESSFEEDKSEKAKEGDVSAPEDSLREDVSLVPGDVESDEMDEMKELNESENSFDVIVPATQQVEEVPSFDSDNPSTIECSDGEDTIPSFIGTNTDADDPGQGKELCNSTFLVSQSPMKVTSRTFFKKKIEQQDLGGVEEEKTEDTTYVMDISNKDQSARSRERGNETYPKDSEESAKESPTGETQSPEPFEKEQDLPEQEVFEVSEPDSELVSEAAPETNPIHDNTTLSLNHSSDSTDPDGEVPDSKSIPEPKSTSEAKSTPESKSVPDQDSNSDPDAVPESVHPEEPMDTLPTPSPKPFSLQRIQSLSSSSSSPRKGKKLYAEPTPPILKSTPAPKTPKSYSSSSESEEESAPAAPAPPKPATPARFKCYNKRGRDSKADREALFEVENPRPTTSAALVRHNARGRKASPKPKEPIVKKVLKKRAAPARSEPKALPEPKKARVVRERRKPRVLPIQLESDDDDVTKNVPEEPLPADPIPIPDPLPAPEDPIVNPAVQVQTHSEPNKNSGEEDPLGLELPEALPDVEMNVVPEAKVQDSTVPEQNMPVLENQSLETLSEEEDQEMPQLQRVTRNRRENHGQPEAPNPPADPKATIGTKRSRNHSASTEVIEEPKSKPGPRSRKIPKNQKIVIPPFLPKLSEEKLEQLKLTKVNTDPVILLDKLPMNTMSPSPTKLHQNSSPQNSNSGQNLNSVRSSPRKVRPRTVLDTITLDSDLEDSSESESEYEPEEKKKTTTKSKKPVGRVTTKSKKVPTKGNNKSPDFVPPPTPLKDNRSILTEEDPNTKGESKKKETRSKRGRAAEASTKSAARKTAGKSTNKKTKPNPPTPPKPLEDEGVRRSSRARKPRDLGDGFVPSYY